MDRTELFRYDKDWPYHVSAGTVTLRKLDDGYEVALLHRGAENFGEESWHLPKGTLHNNETLEHTALRETSEEAGIEVKLLGYIGAIQQSWHNKQSGILIDKTTHYFVAKYVGKANKPMDHEHDDLQWLPVAEAKKKTNLEPEQEGVVIDRALEFLEKFRIEI